MKAVRLLLLCAVLLLSFAQGAHADVYQWFRNGYTQTFPTPKAVCDFYKFAPSSSRPNDTSVDYKLNYSPGATQATCLVSSMPSGYGMLRAHVLMLRSFFNCDGHRKYHVIFTQK